MSRYLLCVYELYICAGCVRKTGSSSYTYYACLFVRRYVFMACGWHICFAGFGATKRMTREMQIYNSIVTYIGSRSSCAYHLYIQPCVWFTRWVLYLLVELDRKQLCVQFLLFLWSLCCFTDHVKAGQIKRTACALHLCFSLFNFLPATSIMSTCRFYILDS